MAARERVPGAVQALVGVLVGEVTHEPDRGPVIRSEQREQDMRGLPTLGVKPFGLRLRALDDEVVTGPRLLKVLEADIKALAPFTDYLCASLDLEF